MRNKDVRYEQQSIQATNTKEIPKYALEGETPPEDSQGAGQHTIHFFYFFFENLRLFGGHNRPAELSSMIYFLMYGLRMLCALSLNWFCICVGLKMFCAYASLQLFAVLFENIYFEVCGAISITKPIHKVQRAVLQQGAHLQVNLKT